MAGQYESLNQIMKGVRKDVITARIDAEEHSNISFRYGIFSFPVVGFFAPKEKRLKGVYRGERVATSLSDWINGIAPFIEVQETPTIKATISEEVKVAFNGSNANNDTNLGSLNLTDAKDELDFVKSELQTVRNTVEMLEKEIISLKFLHSELYIRIFTVKASILDKKDNDDSNNDANDSYSSKSFYDWIAAKAIEIKNIPIPSLFTVLLAVGSILMIIAGIITVKKVNISAKEDKDPHTKV